MQEKEFQKSAFHENCVKNIITIIFCVKFAMTSILLGSHISSSWFRFSPSTTAIRMLKIFNLRRLLQVLCENKGLQIFRSYFSGLLSVGKQVIHIIIKLNLLINLLPSCNLFQSATYSPSRYNSLFRITLVFSFIKFIQNLLGTDWRGSWNNAWTREWKCFLRRDGRLLQVVWIKSYFVILRINKGCKSFNETYKSL